MYSTILTESLIWKNQQNTIGKNLFILPSLTHVTKIVYLSLPYSCQKYRLFVPLLQINQFEFDLISKSRHASYIHMYIQTGQAFNIDVCAFRGRKEDYPTHCHPTHQTFAIPQPTFLNLTQPFTTSPNFTQSLTVPSDFVPSHIIIVACSGSLNFVYLEFGYELLTYLIPIRT